MQLTEVPLACWGAPDPVPWTIPNRLKRLKNSLSLSSTHTVSFGTHRCQGDTRGRRGEPGFEAARGEVRSGNFRGSMAYAFDESMGSQPRVVKSGGGWKVALALMLAAAGVGFAGYVYFVPYQKLTGAVG